MSPEQMQNYQDWCKTLPFSYYAECKGRNLIQYMRPWLERGGFRLRDVDGKIYAEEAPSYASPWHHVVHSADLNCTLWHTIIFDMFAMQSKVCREWGIDGPFVPADCHECYKVVIKPRTLKELFALLTLQKRLEVPSKCGIETRETVNGLYGGYFYCHGLKAGKQRYVQVRLALNADPDLGPDVPAILKRACTEYEMACGPSNKWTITPEQLALEALIKKWIVHDLKIIRQSEQMLAQVHQRWVEWAYANGDMTYLQFTKGERLYPAVVTYHDDLELEPSVSASPDGAPAKSKKVGTGGKKK